MCATCALFSDSRSLLPLYHHRRGVPPSPASLPRPFLSPPRCFYGLSMAFLSLGSVCRSVRYEPHRAQCVIIGYILSCPDGTWKRKLQRHPPHVSMLIYKCGLAMPGVLLLPQVEACKSQGVYERNSLSPFFMAYGRENPTLLRVNSLFRRNVALYLRYAS